MADLFREGSGNNGEQKAAIRIVANVPAIGHNTAVASITNRFNTRVLIKLKGHRIGNVVTRVIEGPSSGHTMPALCKPFTYSALLIWKAQGGLGSRLQFRFGLIGF